MKKFEYQTIVMPSPTANEIQELCNKEGSDSWELVSLTSQPEECVMLVFKKEQFIKEFGDRGERPARKSFGDKPRRSFGDKPFGDRGDRSERPARKPFGDKPRRSFDGDRPKRAFGDKPRKPFGEKTREWSPKPKY